MLPVSVVLLLSAAVIVKLKVPVVVGVPLNTPVPVFSANHDGKLPALTAKMYAPEPPVALKVALYALLAVALVSVVGLTVKLLAAFTFSV